MKIYLENVPYKNCSRKDRNMEKIEKKETHEIKNQEFEIINVNKERIKYGLKPIKELDLDLIAKDI